MHAEDLNADAQLSAYLDGAMSPDDAAAFEAQLDADPSGQEELADMRRLLGALGSLPEPEAPEDFYEQLRRRLRRRGKAPEDLLQQLVALPFQVLSIVIILAAAAIFLMSQLDRDQQQIDRDKPAQVESPALAP